MKARDFEDKFYQVEGIVIVLRTEPDAEVGEYKYSRASAGNDTLQDLRSGRLASSINVPYVIHNGDVEQPHGKTKLSSIRESYKK